MWEVKFFKNESSAKEWMKKHERRYRMVLTFVDNGCAVEYRKLIKIY